MSNTSVNLADGSMVAVVLGRSFHLPKDILEHPQLATFDGMAKYDTGALPPFPANIKAIAYTDGLALDRSQAIVHEAKRRGILYVTRSNDQALADILRVWLATGNKKGIFPGNGPPPPHAPIELTHEKDEPAARREHGSVMAFVNDHVNLKAPTSTAAEGRRLFELAKQKGVMTTLGSITQAVRVAKRKAGVGSLPDSVLPAGERDRLQALKVLDDAIAGLTLMREWVESTERHVEELETENKRFRTTLAGLIGR